MPTADDLLDFAAGEIGYSAAGDPERGTKYGRWYEANVDRCSTNYDYGASGVAYCAMFVSYCLAMVGVECAGFSGAYCPSIHHKQHLGVSELRAGDVALFDWEGDGTDDHVGFVEGNDASTRTLRTIEGNTNGGRVARRTRPWSSVCGGIRPRYGGAAPAEKGEDDVYKFRAVRRGMRGDHVALFQAAYNERFGASLAVDGSAGPATHAAIGDAQRRLGIAQDYSCGPDTWAHLLGA